MTQTSRLSCASFSRFDQTGQQIEVHSMVVYLLETELNDRYVCIVPSYLTHSTDNTLIDCILLTSDRVLSKYFYEYHTDIIFARPLAINLK